MYQHQGDIQDFFGEGGKSDGHATTPHEGCEGMPPTQKAGN